MINEERRVAPTAHIPPQLMASFLLTEPLLRQDEGQACAEQLKASRRYSASEQMELK
jgi:hypothetical protein